MVDRRRKVAGMLLRARTYREIAQEVGVTPATVFKDVQAILKDLETETLREAEAYRKVEMRRLDVALAAIWEAVEDGDPQAVDRLLKIQDQRAKYMPGVQDATRHELSGPNGGPITYLDKQREADRILAQVEAYEQSKRDGAP